MIFMAGDGPASDLPTKWVDIPHICSIKERNLPTDRGLGCDSTPPPSFHDTALITICQSWFVPFSPCGKLSLYFITEKKAVFPGLMCVLFLYWWRSAVRSKFLRVHWSSETRQSPSACQPRVRNAQLADEEECGHVIGWSVCDIPSTHSVAREGEQQHNVNRSDKRFKLS